MADQSKVREPAIAIAKTVRGATISGRVVLLNLRSETYSLLDSDASIIWTRLEHHGGRIDRVIEELSGTMGRAFDDVAREVTDFVSTCTANGLLSTRPDQQTIEPRREISDRRPWLVRRQFLPLAAWWSLTRTARRLSRHGFSQTYSCYAAFAAPSAAPSQGTPLKLAAEQAFLRAENFFAFRRAPFDCLPRSLALFRFLRTAGLPAQHHIGGKFAPFLAVHAWVEVDGIVVLDDPRCAHEYVRIASIPAE